MFLSRFICVVYINVGSRKNFLEGSNFLFYSPGYTLFVRLRKLPYFSQLTVKTNIVLPGKSGGCLADQDQAFQRMSVPLPECG